MSTVGSPRSRTAEVAPLGVVGRNRRPAGGPPPTTGQDNPRRLAEPGSPTVVVTHPMPAAHTPRGLVERGRPPGPEPAPTAVVGHRPEEPPRTLAAVAAEGPPRQGPGGPEEDTTARLVPGGPPLAAGG